MEFILPIFILSVLLIMLLIIKRGLADGRADAKRELYDRAEAIAEARVKSDFYAGLWQ